MAARRRLPRIPSREVRQRYAPRVDPRAAVALARAYLEVLRRIHVIAMVHIEPALRARRQDFREDAAPKLTLKAVKAALTGEAPKLRELVARTAVQMDRTNRLNLAKIPGINPTKIVGGEAVVRGFRERAVGLITTLETKYLKDLASVLDAPENRDLHVGALTKKIQERFDVTESRAKFWARDQTLKLNSELTRTRMQSAGISRYVWTTSNDDRVRGNPDGPYASAEFSHFAREGQVFSFDDPPEDGHPGEAYNCRCIQFPVLDEPEEEKGLGARDEPPPPKEPPPEFDPPVELAPAPPPKKAPKNIPPAIFAPPPLPPPTPPVAPQIIQAPPAPKQVPIPAAPAPAPLPEQTRALLSTPVDVHVYRAKDSAVAASATRAEKDAIQTYTGETYRNINERLRGGAALEGTAKELQDALARAREAGHAVEGAVLRGTALPIAEIAKYTEGAEHTWHGFTSTTISRDTAESFSEVSKVGTQSVLFEIVQKSGIPINALSVNPGEAEALLPHGFKFRVASAEKTIDDSWGYAKTMHRIKLVEL